MSDETETAAHRAQEFVRFARTDWLTLAGDVSLKLLEEGIAIGASLGEVSWDEAVAAFQRRASERLDATP